MFIFLLFLGLGLELGLGDLAQPIFGQQGLKYPMCLIPKRCREREKPQQRVACLASATSAGRRNERPPCDGGSDAEEMQKRQRKRKKKKNGGDDEYVKPKTNAIAKKNRFTHRNLKGGHLGPHHLFYIIKFFLLNYSKRPSSHYKM